MISTCSQGLQSDQVLTTQSAGQGARHVASRDGAGPAPDASHVASSSTCPSASIQLERKKM